MKENNTIRLCHASVDDGDWAEVVPETVRTLQRYLNTNQFAVLTSEEQSPELVNSVIDAFKADQVLDVDDGYILELGKYSGIPAVIFSNGLEAVYFAKSDETAVVSLWKET